MENYEYIDDLGSGSYGFVWKCLQRSSGRIVAVKGFKLAHTDKKFLDQAIREVRMLRAACDHPNIVQLLEAFRSSSGRVYMVFEFVERCLSAELHKRFTCGLPAAQTRLVLWQLLSAVAHLHSKKIIHRDIKPGNLLMTSDWVVKLCDFGFARTTRGEPYQADRFSSYVVTRWYRSPEMLVSDLYGAASDVWSLGCTLAELATGRPLFPGTSSLDQLWRIMRCLGSLPPSQAERFAAAATAAGLPEPPPPPPRGKSLWQRLPELEPRLLDVVQACLRLDPAQRPTAGQLLQMPYFWEIPKVIIGTPLEHMYGENGNARDRSTSGRSKASQQQQQSKGSSSGPVVLASARAALSGGGAPSSSRGPPAAVSVVSSLDLVRPATGDRLGDGTAAGGGAGGVRRSRPREPSMLLSAVAATLIGELPPQQGTSGSVPLVPLASAVGAAELQGVAVGAGTRSSGGDADPQVSVAGGKAAAAPVAAAPMAAPAVGAAAGATAAAAAPGPGDGCGSLAQTVPPTPSRSAAGQTQSSSSGIAVGAFPTASESVQPGLPTAGVAPVFAPLPPSGPARPHASRSLVIRSPSPVSSPTPHPPGTSKPTSSTASPNARLLPPIARHNSSLRRAGLAGSSPSSQGRMAAVVLHAPSLLGLDPSGSITVLSSEVSNTAVGSAGALGSSAQPKLVSENLLASSGLIAAAVPTPAGAGNRGGLSSASSRRGGVGAAGDVGDSARPVQGGGLQPGFGLLGSGDHDVLSDGDGQVSDDDELMEYFAKRSTGSAAIGARNRATTTPSLGMAGSVSVTGAGRGSGSGAGAAPVVSSPSRRMLTDGLHAGVLSVHHGLYGNRHGGGTSLPGMAALSRRTAAVLGGTEAAVGSAGSSPQQRQPQQQQRPAPQLTSPPVAPAPAKRATVMSYLPSRTVAATDGASATGDDSPRYGDISVDARPRTAVLGTSKQMAEPGAPSLKEMPYARPGTDSHAAACALPALGHHQSAYHNVTSTGIGMPQSAAVPMAMTHMRTSLPARGYGPVGAATAGSLTQYGTSGTPSGSRSRALSRQGSVVFNQLMYDALPEIGTPGGAPEVPTGTPPRRRIVMSGFTPCRTAAARAAAEGIPPAAAMAAVMGDVLQSITTDISVPFSPIHGARSVDLLSPDQNSGLPSQHSYDMPPGGLGGAPASATAVASTIRRQPHRRHASSYFPDPSSGFVPSSSVGAAGPSFPVPAPPGNGPGQASATSDTGMLLGSSAPTYFRNPRGVDGAVSNTGTSTLSAAGPLPIPNGTNPIARVQGAINATSPAGSSPSPGPVTAFAPASRTGHPQQLTPAVRSRLASGNMTRTSDASVGHPHHIGGGGVTDGTQSLELDGIDGAGMSPGAAGGGIGTGVGGTMLHPYHTQQPFAPHHGAYAYAGPGGPGQPPLQMGGRGRVQRWAAAGLIDSLPEDREVVHAVYGGVDWQGGQGYGMAGVGGSGAGLAQPHVGVGSAVEGGPGAIETLACYSSEGTVSGSQHQVLTSVLSGRQPVHLLATGSVAGSVNRQDAGAAALAVPRSPPAGSVSARSGVEVAAAPWQPAEPRLPRSGSGAEHRGQAPFPSGGSTAGGAGATDHHHHEGGGGGVTGTLSRLYPFRRSRRSLTAIAPGSATGLAAATAGAPRNGAYGETSAVDDSAYISPQRTAEGAAAGAATASGTVTSVGGRTSSGSRESQSGFVRGGVNTAANTSSSSRKTSSSGGKWPRAKALLGGRLISSLVRKFKDSGNSGEK